MINYMLSGLCNVMSCLGLLIYISGFTGIRSRELKFGYLSSVQNPGAINLAVEAAQASGLLSNFNITYYYGKTECKSGDAIKEAMDMILKNDVDVIFGPECSISCISTGYAAAYYNTPMLPESCIDSTMDDKSTYTTMIRMRGSFNAFGLSFYRLFLYYKWYRIVVLTDSANGNECQFGVENLNTWLQPSNVTIAEWIRMSAAPDELEIDNYVDRVKQRGRIIFICHTYLKVVHEIMFSAQDKGMLNGEFAFFTFFSNVSTADAQEPWTLYNSSGMNLSNRMEAFIALKQMTSRDSGDNNTEQLLASVQERNKFPPWNLNYSLPGREAIYLYDAVTMYMQLANETLQDAHDDNSVVNSSAVDIVSDGVEIFNRCLGRQFTGMSGSANIDHNGDRELLLTMWTYNPARRVYVPYLTIDPNTNRGGVTPVKNSGTVLWGINKTDPPKDTPKCGFLGEMCPPGPKPTVANTIDVAGVVAGAGTGSVSLVIIAAILYVVRAKMASTRIQQMLWKINFEDVHLIHNDVNNSTLLRASSRHHDSADTVSGHISMTDVQSTEILALHKGHVVRVVTTCKLEVNPSRQDLVDLINLKELVHDNIETFVGACVDPGHVCYLVQHPRRGTLRDILEDDEMKLDWFFRASLISDLANGMSYLHKSPFHSHGGLSSLTCRMDSRWVLKVGCPVLPLFRDDPGHVNHVSVSEVSNIDQNGGTQEQSDDERYRNMIWTAPEILRMKVPPVYGTQKGDVYSFAIVAQEISYRAPPFFLEDASEYKDVVQKIIDGGLKPCRPLHPDTGTYAAEPEQPEFWNLIAGCWAEYPGDRPSFDDILKVFRRWNQGRKFDIVDHIQQKLEKYATNLESVVEKRTAELLEEKRKTDMLLNRMLPPFVAEELKVGKTVPPEMFPGVTVYFSDIVGFTNLSAESTPMQVVDLLNDLYGTFDDTISRHDVYKVETIGDAYMVVSGLPRPNGGRHIVEICNMALDLLRVASVFKIRHMPESPLRLRIGVHSGPCAAGVVGHTMPRYCLFGDTVNVASRMESTGEASKIHLSQTAREALSQFPAYITESRGETFVKGKGTMTTYWLLGKVEMGPTASQ